MDTGAALGGAGLVVSIAGVIYSAINHKHIKSKCCGKEYDVSIDIGSTEEAKKAAEATGNAKTEIVTTSAKVAPLTKEGSILSYKPLVVKPFPKLNLDY
jgi:hypothetical protein